MQHIDLIGLRYNVTTPGRISYKHTGRVDLGQEEDFKFGCDDRFKGSVSSRIVVQEFV